MIIVGADRLQAARRRKEGLRRNTGTLGCSLRAVRPSITALSSMDAGVINATPSKRSADARRKSCGFDCADVDSSLRINQCGRMQRKPKRDEGSRKSCVVGETL